MDDTKLAVAFVAVAATAILLFFFYPIMFFVAPILLAVVYLVFHNKQCDADSLSTYRFLPFGEQRYYRGETSFEHDKSKTFFDGWRFGGHRGSPGSFPENSYSGFVQAVHEGADLIEFDLSLTKDGIAVLLHDDTLDRTTNLTGPVKEKTLSELQTANLAVKFTRNPASPAKGAVPDETIPTLEAVVQYAVKNNVRMLFDVKDYSDEMVAIIVNFFEQYDLYNRAIVCSFYPWVVYKIKRVKPTILTGLTWRQRFFSFADLNGTEPRYSGPKQWAAEILDFLYLISLKTLLPSFLGADLLFSNVRDIDTTFVEMQRSKQLRVAVWTVNDMVHAQWMQSQFGIPILTDFPFLGDNLKRLQKFVNNGYH